MKKNIKQIKTASIGLLLCGISLIYFWFIMQNPQGESFATMSQSWINWSIGAAIILCFLIPAGLWNLLKKRPSF
jgi:hypothetical protein